MGREIKIVVLFWPLGCKFRCPISEFRPRNTISTPKSSQMGHENLFSTPKVLKIYLGHEIQFSTPKVSQMGHENVFLTPKNLINGPRKLIFDAQSLTNIIWATTSYFGRRKSHKILFGPRNLIFDAQSLTNGPRNRVFDAQSLTFGPRNHISPPIPFSYFHCTFFLVYYSLIPQPPFSAPHCLVPEPPTLARSLLHLPLLLLPL